ncbi:unnamed protein product [Sphenostylis stenocarpa]|uniref:Uncharacterized protein n=1 Tax=Sphenostylis stenocarpa TaxID=92480 RepID=A0AA86VT38_9FABA|nr:unnamed protein product [Sphenostylis stenocarpa]
MAKNSNSNVKSQNMINVKAVVTIEQSDGGLVPNLINSALGGIEELAGKTFALELVSEKLYPRRCSSLLRAVNEAATTFFVRMTGKDIFGVRVLRDNSLKSKIDWESKATGISLRSISLMIPR